MAYPDAWGINAGNMGYAAPVQTPTGAPAWSPQPQQVYPAQPGWAPQATGPAPQPARTWAMTGGAPRPSSEVPVGLYPQQPGYPTAPGGPWQPGVVLPARTDIPGERQYTQSVGMRADPSVGAGARAPVAPVVPIPPVTNTPLGPGQVQGDPRFTDQPGMSVGAQIIRAVGARAASGQPFDTAWGEGLWRTAGLDPHGAQVAHEWSRVYQARFGPMTEGQINALIGSVRATGQGPPMAAAPTAEPDSMAPRPPVPIVAVPGGAGHNPATPVAPVTPPAQTVPLPWQVNPLVWDSMSPTDQALAQGAAGKAGWAWPDYLQAMQRARPQGSSLGGAMVRYANPRSQGV